MIPRFIIRNVDGNIITLLKQLGYMFRENPVPSDVLVIGRSVIQAPPLDKNPLTVIFVNGKTNGNGVIIQQANLHWKWQDETMQGKFINIKLDKATVTVTRFGVLIDSYVVPMQSFMELAHILKEKLIAPYPQIATHNPIPIAKSTGEPANKLTIGCADYSLDDFNKILGAYNSLLTT